MSQKTVLITGANRGLGAAFAKEAHDQGFRVIGTERDISTLDTEHVDQPYALDLSKQNSIAHVCSEIQADGLQIDLLINNAGLNPGWMRTDMGGSNAERTPTEVAQAVYALWRDGKLSAANGKFLNTDGSIHPW